MWYDATRGSVGNQIQFPVDVTIITARKRSLRRLCFYTCGSVYGGGGVACMAGGCAWQGACVAEMGMRVRGCVCGRGACMAGACRVGAGACMAGGACVAGGGMRAMTDTTAYGQ